MLLAIVNLYFSRLSIVPSRYATIFDMIKSSWQNVEKELSFCSQIKEKAGECCNTRVSGSPGYFQTTSAPLHRRGKSRISQWDHRVGI